MIDTAMATQHRPTKLGMRVKELRDSFGWSQYQLAVESKVSPATIHKIESGKTQSPGTSILESIAHSLGVGLDELLGNQTPTDLFGKGWKERAMRESAPNTPPEVSREFLALLDRLDASDRDAARAMLLGLAQEKQDGGVSGKRKSADYRIGRKSEDEYKAEGER